MHTSNFSFNTFLYCVSVASLALSLKHHWWIISVKGSFCTNSTTVSNVASVPSQNSVKGCYCTKSKKSCTWWFREDPVVECKDFSLTGHAWVSTFLGVWWTKNFSLKPEDFCCMRSTWVLVCQKGWVDTLEFRLSLVCGEPRISRWSLRIWGWIWYIHRWELIGCCKCTIYIAYWDCWLSFWFLVWDGLSTSHQTWTDLCLNRIVRWGPFDWSKIWTPNAYFSMHNLVRRNCIGLPHLVSYNLVLIVMPA